MDAPVLRRDAMSSTDAMCVARLTSEKRSRAAVLPVTGSVFAVDAETDWTTDCQIEDVNSLLNEMRASSHAENMSKRVNVAESVKSSSGAPGVARACSRSARTR